jgi:dTDP-glucose pyrophosphorylase
MIRAGADKICFVISPGKSDILEYYSGTVHGAYVCYAVQSYPAGLCDAIFRALPLVDRDEPVIVGLPDTIWFPDDALCFLPDDALSFLLFPVERPEFFDAVLMDADGGVSEIRVKQPNAGSHWVWGAFKMPGAILRQLHELWEERSRADEYIGTLVNAHLARGGHALGIKAGTNYVDVGTLNGYREAMRLLGAMHECAGVEQRGNSTAGYGAGRLVS